MLVIHNKEKFMKISTKYSLYLAEVFCFFVIENKNINVLFNALPYKRKHAMGMMHYNKSIEIRQQIN